jgi:trigger factor
MKKIALAAVALLLLISMVGCGTFSYNIKSYVKVADYNNGDVVFVDKDKLDKAVKEAVDNLIDSYPEIKDKTEGTVAKDDTVYIYYEGTLILFEGETTIKVDSDEVKAVVGFNEALKKAEFKDGKASFELTLDKAFTVPAFAKKVEAPKEDDTSKDDTSKDDAAKAAPAAEPSEEEPSKGSSSSSTTSTPSYFAGKKTKVEITIEGKNGKVTDGEELKMTLRWTEPGFDGGTYNKATEDEANKKNSASASASASTSTSEEPKKPGYALKIGSNSFIKGFEDGLIGVSVAVNTEKLLKLTFPTPYSSKPALAGVDVEFAVTILSVTEEIKRDPAVQAQFDAIKADVLKESENAVFDFKNIDEYKAFVETAKKLDLVTTKLLYASEMKRVPYSDYQEYKENYENYLYQTLYYQALYGGNYAALSDFNTLITKVGGFKSVDAYNQHVADQAVLNLKRDLALYQVAKDQGLTKVTAEDEEEYINYYNNLSGSKSLTKDNLYEQYGDKDEAHKTIVLYKAQMFLAEKAPVKTVTVTK